VAVCKSRLFVAGLEALPDASYATIDEWTLAHASRANTVPDCELHAEKPMDETVIAAGSTSARSFTRLAEPAARRFQQEAAHCKTAVKDLTEQFLAREHFGQRDLVLRDHTQTAFRSISCRSEGVDG
jgi:hypothetical protein